MENKNDLLRLVSQALQQNQAIHEEMLKVLNLNVKDDGLKVLRVKLEQNKQLLRLITDATPID